MGGRLVLDFRNRHRLKSRRVIPHCPRLGKSGFIASRRAAFRQTFGFDPLLLSAGFQFVASFLLSPRLRLLPLKFFPFDTLPFGSDPVFSKSISRWASACMRRSSSSFCRSTRASSSWTLRSASKAGAFGGNSSLFRFTLLAGLFLLPLPFMWTLPPPCVPRKGFGRRRQFPLNCSSVRASSTAMETTATA